MATLDKIEDRLHKVELQMSAVTERLNHMPTTAALWRAVAVSGGAVIAAMWLIVQFLAKPWIEQLMHGLGGK